MHLLALAYRDQRYAKLSLIFQAQNRVAFGKPLLAQGTVQADIASSRIELEQARLLTLKAAHMMDTVGNKVSLMDGMTEIGD